MTEIFLVFHTVNSPPFILQICASWILYDSKARLNTFCISQPFSRKKVVKLFPSLFNFFPLQQFSIKSFYVFARPYFHERNWKKKLQLVPLDHKNHKKRVPPSCLLVKIIFQKVPYTVWKFKKNPVGHILREINFS